MSMNLKKYALCVMALGILLVAGGCDQGQKKDPAEPSSPPAVSTEKPSSPSEKEQEPKKPETKELSVTLYYPNDEGTKLVAVSRKVKFTGEGEKYAATLKSLMEGTKEKGQTTILPKKTKLRSVKFQDGVVTVDFSGDLTKHFVGGSTGEEMLVGSVVNTLTEFSEVKSVRFLIDGHSIESIAGHMDLTGPVQRMDTILGK